MTSFRVSAARAIVCFVLCGTATPTLAGGGAHVIDDASVETPGTCHLESWVTEFGGEAGLLNISPACTPTAWPDLEIGAGFQHSWDATSSTQAGPALKLNLGKTGRGVGLAIAATAGWDLRTGKFESASLIVPVTVAAGPDVQLNVNGGWIYSRAGAQRHSAFVGAQVEVQLAPDLTLMGEAFGRSRGKPGVQTGLRWNPHRGRVDVDFLAGHGVDGTSRAAVTLGPTVRN